jgi:hypothetical protein
MVRTNPDNAPPSLVAVTFRLGLVVVIAVLPKDCCEAVVASPARYSS